MTEHIICPTHLLTSSVFTNRIVLFLVLNAALWEMRHHVINTVTVPIAQHNRDQRFTLRMSSDDDFDDSEWLDPAFLAELDVIEAAHTQQTSSTCAPIPSTPSSTSFTPPTLLPFSITSTSKRHTSAFEALPSQPNKLAPVPIDVDSDESYDMFFDKIDANELARLDKDVEEAYNHDFTIPCRNTTSGTAATRQLTLFGDVLPPPAHKLPCLPHQQQQGEFKPPHSPRNPFGQKARKTKKWDHTAFAKSGWRSGKNIKEKGKAKAVYSDVDAGEDDQSNEEFEQFPAPIPESAFPFLYFSR